MYYWRDEKDEFDKLHSKSAREAREAVYPLMQKDLNAYEQEVREVFDKFGYVYIEFDPDGAEAKEFHNFSANKHRKDVASKVLQDYLTFYDTHFDSEELSKTIINNFNWFHYGTGYYFYDLTRDRLDTLVAESEKQLRHKGSKELLIKKIKKECEEEGFDVLSLHLEKKYE